MATFAKIGSNNEILDLVAVNDDVLLDSDNVSQESIGIDFLTNITNWSVWKQTYPDGSIRKNYAGIGYIYDENRDAFIGIKPYASWVLNETTCRWDAPVAKPDDASDEIKYFWNESTLSWNLALI
tara:strand:+ start:133 stop:507 length:375 start_codon:yes stop_codon:yes gene_type:complete